MERYRLAMVFQSGALLNSLTVEENVGLVPRLERWPADRIRARANELLDLVGLPPRVFASRRPSELSGGQRQRVGVARALAVDPPILLMDEPLSNLDANLREEMRFEIRRLHEEFRITTIYVTHDQAEAMATSDRIAVLDRGRLIQVGRPSEIFDRPKTRFVAEFVGKANILTGRLDGKSLALPDGTVVRLGRDGAAVSSGEASICLRPHNVILVGDANAARDLADQGCNLFPGTIGRSIYFGDAVDYTIELSSGATLRVIAPPAQRFAVGQTIYAAAHPDHCILIKND